MDLWPPHVHEHRHAHMHRLKEASAYHVSPKEVQGLAGEMAQQLRVAALPEVLRSIPTNHMVAHNHL